MILEYMKKICYWLLIFFFQLKSAADPTPNVPVRRWRIAWSIVTVRPAMRAPREPPVQRVGLFFKFCLELFERFLFVFVLKESWFLIVFHQSQVSYSEWQSKPSFFFLDSFYYLQIFFFYLEKTNRKYLLKILENNKNHT